MEQLYNEYGLEAVPTALGQTLSQQHTGYVTSYPSPGSKQIDENGLPFAFRYPGQRPEASFAVANEFVNACVLQASEQPEFYINTLPAQVKASGLSELVYNLDDFLQSVGSEPMSERYPVIAFGSNANPGQLAQKFTKLEGADKTIVPTVMAKIKGVVPVYAARIGINGYVFADLFPGGDDVESEVHVNFLSHAQLEVMNATEKAYTLCEMSNVMLETADGNGLQTNAYLYVGREDTGGANILVDEAGKPIRLQEIASTGSELDERFAVMNQQAVHGYIHEIASARIAKNLYLDTVPTDAVELTKIVINRADDPQLANFREFVADDDQPLGRLVGKSIQSAIASTDRTAEVSGLRKIIPRDSQDIKLDAVHTFGELIKPY